MENEVTLKVTGNTVKVVHEKGNVSHVFECNDLTVEGIMKKLKDETQEYDLDSYQVLDILLN